MPSSHSAASEPPAIITSAMSCWMNRAGVADGVGAGGARGGDGGVRAVDAET